ncbi:MAG: acyltransferase [Thermoplasmata archaeon]|nr:MAG: acyltransferase [Thermoplasmata archaeon]
MTSILLFRLLFKHFPNKFLISFRRKMPYETRRHIAASHPNHDVRLTFLRDLGVKIGKDSYINQNFTVIVDTEGTESKLTIGERVSIAPNVTIIVSSAPNNSVLVKNEYARKHLIKTAPVRIGDDAWLGSNTVIFPGVSIGKRAIVGAGAVVREDVPADTIVAGVPAKVIRKIPKK